MLYNMSNKESIRSDSFLEWKSIRPSLIAMFYDTISFIKLKIVKHHEKTNRISTKSIKQETLYHIMVLH